MALKLTLSVHVFTILQAPSRHIRREHAHDLATKKWRLTTEKTPSRD
jgi:hypothetical protein